MLNNIVGIYGSPTPVSTNSYESIATANGTGSSGTITFSVIPSTYKHLQIRGILKNTNGGAYDDPTYMRFNGDTGSNYSYHALYGNGSGAAASAGTSSVYIVSYGTPANNFTNIWGGAVIDILDYADTNKYKTSRWLNGFDSNTTTGSIDFTSGNWRSTSAITSISFITAGGNWATNTTLALYGIKG
jgi:hypothetical protein